MAHHMNLFAKELGTNDCYLEMIKGHLEDGIINWNYDNLLYEYGKVSVREILDCGFIGTQKRGEIATLSFAIPGTVPSLIVKMLSKEICYFQDIHDRLPQKTQCTISQLRDILVFLLNFEIIQIFPLPASAVTCITINNNEDIELEIDNLFKFSDRVEREYLFHVGSEDEVREMHKVLNHYDEDS
jgi:hypothetical protein